jgi:hypothetical protein
MKSGAYLWDISKINYQRNKKPKFVTVVENSNAQIAYSSLESIVTNIDDLKDAINGDDEIKVFDGVKVTQKKILNCNTPFLLNKIYLQPKIFCCMSNC